MQLISITPSRYQSKVWLKFSDDSLIPFKLDDIILLGIKKLTDLDNSTLQKIYQSSLRFLLLEFALRQVAISPKTKDVLLPKIKQKLLFLLKKYHYPQDNYSFLIDYVLDYLASSGLLKNDQFRDYFINKSKSKSRLEISFLLKSKGVSFLPQDLPSDLPKIRHILQKKLKNTDPQDPKSKNKLISALVRKGFALNEVKSMIDDLAFSM